MVLVISHYERNSDTGINQSVGFESSRLASVGVTKRLHKLVADGAARSGNHQAPVGLNERVIVDRNHPQRSAVRGQLDVAWPQPQLIAQRLGYDQMSCLING